MTTEADDAQAPAPMPELSIAEDRRIAQRLLGSPTVTRMALEPSSHPITAWTTGARALVIKHSPRSGWEAQVATRAAERGLAPPVLDHTASWLAIAWQSGGSLVETVTPEALVGDGTLVERLTTLVATFHDAVSDLTEGVVAGPVPGPYGFCHRDLLPHNCLVSSGCPLLIDFDAAGDGPLYLDLLPLLCVLPLATLDAQWQRYHELRRLPAGADEHQAWRAVVRQYPALRLRRLHQQAHRFRHHPVQYQRLLAWLSAARARHEG